MALPSSRVTPLEACPALRPRWCPIHSPKRVWDCCLPVRANRRLSPQDYFEGYPAVHDATHCGAPSRGLLSAFTPASYSHCWAGTWSSLLTCWLGVRQVGLEPQGSHPLGNNNQFRGLSPSSKVSGLPWREHALVRRGSALGVGVCHCTAAQALRLFRLHSCRHGMLKLLTGKGLCCLLRRE
jgi:hypothetical protein